jgi:hypothetical protein
MYYSGVISMSYLLLPYTGASNYQTPVGIGLCEKWFIFIQRIQVEYSWANRELYYDWILPDHIDQPMSSIVWL